MAIRATALLFPLLGMTNILFCVEPSSNIVYKLVYRFANALLQCLQVLDIFKLYVHTSLVNIMGCRTGKNTLLQSPDGSVAPSCSS